MSVTGLSCMFQQRPARARAETGGVISLHRSLFLPPAGLSFSLLFCHTPSLSQPFLSSVSLLLSCVRSFLPQISFHRNVKMLLTSENTARFLVAPLPPLEFSKSCVLYWVWAHRYVWHFCVFRWEKCWNAEFCAEFSVGVLVSARAAWWKQHISSFISLNDAISHRTYCTVIYILAAEWLHMKSTQAVRSPVQRAALFKIETNLLRQKLKMDGEQRETQPVLAACKKRVSFFLDSFIASSQYFCLMCRI